MIMWLWGNLVPCRILKSCPLRKVWWSTESELWDNVRKSYDLENVIFSEYQNVHLGRLSSERASPFKSATSSRFQPCQRVAGGAGGHKGGVAESIWHVFFLDTVSIDKKELWPFLFNPQGKNLARREASSRQFGGGGGGIDFSKLFLFLRWLHRFLLKIISYNVYIQ